MMEKIRIDQNVLPYLRHYVNLIGAEGRAMRRSDVYIGGFMKKFLLASNRLLNKFLQQSFTQIVLSERSSYALSPDGWQFHMDNVRTLISLLALCQTGSQTIHIARESNITNIDRQLISAIYKAAKLNVPLHIDESLRSMLIDQVLADSDVQMAASSTSQPVEAFIAYGLQPVSNVHKVHEEPYSKITVRRCGNSEAARQADDLESQFQHGCRRIEELYAVDVLPHATTSMAMENFNFLSLLQYLPLPSFPDLKILRAGFKLLDLNPNDLPVVYDHLLSEINTATGGCNIFLSNKTLLYCTTYKRQELMLKKLIDAFKAFYEFSKEDDVSKFEQLHCQIRIYLPTEKTKCINSWLKLMNTINTCYVLETRSDKWSFQAKLKDPHADSKVSGERYSLGITVNFNDNVITELNGNDFLMME